MGNSHFQAGKETGMGVFFVLALLYVLKEVLLLGHGVYT